MKSLAFDMLNNSSECLLTAYKPTKFLINHQDMFFKNQFNTVDKLKLICLDRDGALYSDVRFPASFLRKLDISGIGFFAFTYKTNADEQKKYALVLKALRHSNPSYILLR